MPVSPAREAGIFVWLFSPGLFTRPGGSGIVSAIATGKERIDTKIFIPPQTSPTCARTLAALGAETSFTDMDSCDGLLLPGGGDVHPRRYGQPICGAADIDEDRDELELHAFDAFMRAGRPILGICRGSQLINVALGGTLQQHIPRHSRIGETDRLHPSRTIDETLRALYGERFIINSAHHQAMDRLGDGLRAVQWAEDGTVEAIRHETLPILGVQWHPERLRAPTDGWRLLAWWLGTMQPWTFYGVGAAAVGRAPSRTEPGALRPGLR